MTLRPCDREVREWLVHGGRQFRCWTRYWGEGDDGLVLFEVQAVDETHGGAAAAQAIQSARFNLRHAQRVHGPTGPKVERLRREAYP